MWAVVLLSYPTLGCIGYSLGIGCQKAGSRP
jgi:hypothetical protein